MFWASCCVDIFLILDKHMFLRGCTFMDCIIALKASGRDCTNNNELLHKIGVL